MPASSESVAVEPAVAVDGLVKAYAGDVAVDGVSLRVEAGHTLALLGRNGAGKTTTVECVLGFRRPDDGTVRLLGGDPHRERPALMEHVGVSLQEGGVHQAATPDEVLSLHAALHAAPTDVDSLLARLGLQRVARRRYRHLSGGEKQRLHLALALCGRPRLLVLDEPTAGLDVVGRHDVWELLDELRAHGTAMLLTTHLVEEAEHLADDVVVIHDGRVRAAGRPGELVDRHSPRGLRLTTSASFEPGALAGAIGAEVRRIRSEVYLLDAEADAIPAVAAWFAARGLQLRGVQAGGGLEGAFLALTADPVGADTQTESESR